MRALVVSGDGFEDRELQVPTTELRRSGIPVDVATPGGEPIHGKRGATVNAELAIDAVNSANYDVLILPGGNAPAKLRKDAKVLSVARDFFEAQKLVAAVCHGPQILVSADLLRGKRATSYAPVAPELKAAGADYVDEEVVVDGNLVTSRKPADLPAFVRTIKEQLEIRSSTNRTSG